jgi:hypothetical protein
LFSRTGLGERNEAAVVWCEIWDAIVYFRKARNGGLQSGLLGKELIDERADFRLGRRFDFWQAFKDGRHGDCIPRSDSSGTQEQFDLLNPSGKGLIVIDITLDQGSKAFGAEGGETLIELTAALAKRRVVRIAQCENGIVEG